MDPATERRVARLAARQYGLITRAQLTELGFGRGSIARRLQAGRLIAVHTGVYAVGHRRTEPAARAAAAVLAGGPGAVLSHASAAVLWGIRPRWAQTIEITVPGDRRPAGIRVHRSKALTRRDIRHHLAIRLTSPARTLLDTAPGLTEPALARAVNDARLSPYMRPSDLAELLHRVPHHPGARLLAPFLRAPAGPTRSEFEDRFLAFTRQHDLPTPQINVVIAGWEVDAVFPAEKLIVELDSWAYHANHGSFERDRERDAATLQAGHATVRVTWPRLNHHGDREAARLHTILAARRALTANADQP